ncbi:MAG TPA: hypothetical protein VHM90_08740, partial [Phycisphaerae bacterium]|nr:hypothetical protein [Phycisphaerae bacterium]
MAAAFAHPLRPGFGPRPRIAQAGRTGGFRTMTVHRSVCRAPKRARHKESPMIAVARVMDDLPAAQAETPGGNSREEISQPDLSLRIAHALRQRISEERFDLWFGDRTRILLAGNTLI